MSLEFCPDKAMLRTHTHTGARTHSAPDGTQTHMHVGGGLISGVYLVLAEIVFSCGPITGALLWSVKS